MDCEIDRYNYYFIAPWEQATIGVTAVNTTFSLLMKPLAYQCYHQLECSQWAASYPPIGDDRHDIADVWEQTQWQLYVECVFRWL